MTAGTTRSRQPKPLAAEAFQGTICSFRLHLAGAYIYLLAAGAVAIDGWLAARRGRMRDLMAATAISTVVALPLVLPVLPAADIGWTYKVNQELAESIGWPQLIGTVRMVWTSLPPR